MNLLLTLHIFKVLSTGFRDIHEKVNFGTLSQRKGGITTLKYKSESSNLAHKIALRSFIYVLIFKLLTILIPEIFKKIFNFGTFSKWKRDIVTAKDNSWVIKLGTCSGIVIFLVYFKFQVKTYTGLRDIKKKSGQGWTKWFL